ncbi:hypothetical protein M5K25_007918 [Dendrobium thyrsiflorum]|uniref:Uncharacterized protein n=1 Tax=Dendrobium thyrsiflorum TaxID=117978 RepID=A0ABD0V7T6_DENTH
MGMEGHEFMNMGTLASSKVQARTMSRGRRSYISSKAAIALFVNKLNQNSSIERESYNRFEKNTGRSKPIGKKSEVRKTSRRSSDTSNRTICKKTQPNSDRRRKLQSIWGKHRKKKAH